MLTSILKQIWNERRSNIWLFAELSAVFILLWYVVDYQFTATYVAHESKGYDTHHVYHVSIGINPNLRDEYPAEEWKDSYLQLFRQVREYPGVESACYYGGTVPYEEGAMFQGYTVDSIHRYIANIRMVSKEFFQVFKVEILQGNPDNWDVATYPRPAIASKDLADSLFRERPAIGQPFFDYYAPFRKYTLGGIAPRTKLTEYDRYEPFIYVPTEDWMLTQWAPMLSVRVNKDVEEGFADRFTTDMRNLAIGPFYFSQIKSYDESKAIFDTKTNNYLRSSLALVSFFVFNVTLGVLGTFWFRTRKRRGEIGLRLALGASRREIFKELLTEGLLILSIAVIPALVVCVNIWLADLTVNVWADPTLSRFLSGAAITLVLMLLTVSAGIWYPAIQATKIQPATALHEE
ncbi:MAG: FtsX-like permease family protein [Mediterranea sp.]|jgi:putative ABC transport system permease protein|nr:FtsX-like permease family protein [Mediterranea sp.]